MKQSKQFVVVDEQAGIGRQAGRQADKQTSRQADKQATKQSTLSLEKAKEDRKYRAGGEERREERSSSEMSCYTEIDGRTKV